MVNRLFKTVSIALLILLHVQVVAQNLPALIDNKATKKTKNLFKNMKSTAATAMMFGHQDDLAYGVGWQDQEGRSDVKDVTGSYPAVYGWDLGKVSNGTSLDNVSMNKTRQWMMDIYQRGGINTISLHWDNFASGGNAWDPSEAVKHILPGGKDHKKYVAELDILAAYIKSVKVGSTPVPMIFRPFHEHNGNWFWWGKGNCTEGDFIAIWRFTVDYLKDTKKIHQLIYAFSPDASRLNNDSLQQSYLYGYPGDDYVDMLGIDDYGNVGRSENPNDVATQAQYFIANLQMVDQLAKERGKLAALTETGLESVSNPKWFTEILLAPIKKAEGLQISYFLVWRNANDKHHYAPYPGHTAADDFNEFCHDKRILMEQDLKNMYK